jgi:hypothetical protein
MMGNDKENRLIGKAGNSNSKAKEINEYECCCKITSSTNV